jgi:uncharacterized protein with FMN-binding domain
MSPRNLTALSAGAIAVALGLAACSADSPGASSIESNSTPTETTTTQATPQSQETTQAVTPTPSTGATSESDFRDGEYSATGWYGGLPSHHEINTPAEDETSLGYQQRFVAALPDAVVGRDISDLTVDRLAGSSGCSEGFMDALAQIKEQASA